MIVYGNERPIPIEVQPHPQRPGYSIVTMREAAVQGSDGNWRYEEHSAVVPASDALAEAVAANTTAWLDSLRAQDMEYQSRMAAEANVAALDAAVLELEYQNALLELGM